MQSDPRTVFGVHSFTPYDRTTKLPYGTAKVVHGSTFSLKGDTIELMGGSSRFAWQIEDGDIKAELAFSVSEYPNWLFTLFGGKAPTQGTSESSGFVSAIADFKGSSVVAAAGLLATVTVASPADLKTGKYVILATAVNAFKVYAMSDVDFGRGTPLAFIDDSNCIAAFTAVAGSGSTHSIPSLGITLTTGASPAAFVVGDTAEFEIRAINTLNREVVVGGLSDVFPEFGAYIYAQKRGSGAIFEIEAFKLKSIGMGLGAERKAFGKSDYTAKAAFDSVRGGICKVREVE